MLEGIWIVGITLLPGYELAFRWHTIFYTAGCPPLPPLYDTLHCVYTPLSEIWNDCYMYHNNVIHNFNTEEVIDDKPLPQTQE